MSELSACSNCWGTGFDMAGRPCTHPPLQWRNPAPNAAPPSVPSSPTVHLHVGVTDVRQTAEYSYGYQQALEDMKNTRAPSATSAGVDEVARDAEFFRWHYTKEARTTSVAIVDIEIRILNDDYPTIEEVREAYEVAIQSAARGDES